MFKRFRNIKNSWLLSVFVLAFVLAPFALVAQQGLNIRGTVSDEQGPLAGVTVSIKHKRTAASTDAQGNFLVEGASVGDTLLFRIVGYIDQEVPINNAAFLKILLESDNVGLDEVVVVGYGTHKKVSVTAAISTIETKELKQSPSANLSSALAGRLPGLTALQSSVQPGADVVNLYLRGAGTLNDASPLILIDGVPRSNISKIDPNEVASVSILKDVSRSEERTCEL